GPKERFGARADKLPGNQNLVRADWSCVSCRPQMKRKISNPCGIGTPFRGDNASQNGDNDQGVENLPHIISLGRSTVIASRSSVVLIALFIGSIVVAPLSAQAQWWSRAPADFEDCADSAEKATSNEERKSQLSQCNAKFAG